MRPKEDLREMQRREGVSQALPEFATRYLEMLQDDDLYMASNFFQEMFYMAWSEEEVANISARVGRVKARLNEAIENALPTTLASDQIEVAEDKLAEDFERNFDLAAMRYVPKEFEKRKRHQVTVREEDFEEGTSF